LVAIAVQLYRIAVLLCPLVGIGLAVALTGRALGTGIQPTFVPVLAGLAILFVAVLRSPRAEISWTGDRIALVCALSWTALSTTALWRLDHIGMVGEVAWLKSQKQLLTLFFFVAMALLPSWLVGRVSAPREMLRGLERMASAALLFAASLALLQVFTFRLAPEFSHALRHWFSTNPSIAAGSEELYLGHQFTGIARARGPFPEPLHLGSFLIATVPLAVAVAVAERGWSRWWRVGAAGSGAVALALTFSRGAYLGLGVVAIGAVVAMTRGALPRPGRRHAFAGVVLTLGVGTTLLAWATATPPWALPGLFLDRAMQSLADHDMSNLTRFYAWEAAWSMLRAHPLTGVGWGGFGFHYYSVAPAGGAGAHFGWPMANSLVLLCLAETGVVGLLLWARALWPALRSAFVRQSVSSGGHGWSAICTVLALSVLGVLIHALTFSQWNLPHLWILVGSSVAAAALIDEVV
jgi:O-antigen ligase